MNKIISIPLFYATSLIDTSAYDTMFVECDDYVWKIGPRHFPWGIALDAGSDWYMLHYNFVEYVTNSKDDLVEPLKVYFNYSIAAAEVNVFKSYKSVKIFKHLLYHICSFYGPCSCHSPPPFS